MVGPYEYIRSKIVHRLVADAFCEKRVGTNYVDHIDGDKLNNKAENLRWVTASENVRNPNTSSQAKKRVSGTLKNGNTVVFSSGVEAAEKVGCCPSSISLCCNGKRRTAKGYSWRFI